MHLTYQRLNILSIENTWLDFNQEQDSESRVGMNEWAYRNIRNESL